MFVFIMPTSDKFCGQTRFIIRSRNRAVAFFWQVLKLCTEDLDWILLYILMPRTYTKFARKHRMLAHGVCFPQTCTSADRLFAASNSRLHYY